MPGPLSADAQFHAAICRPCGTATLMCPPSGVNLIALDDEIEQHLPEGAFVRQHRRQIGRMISIARV